MVTLFTPCMLGNISYFLLSSAHFSQKKTTVFSKIYLRKTIRMSEGLDPGIDRKFLSPDLGPNNFQRYSADGNCRR